MMDNIAGISVIIPAASAPAVFEECLNSVFSGSWKPCEVLLIDDAMDRRAYEIARRFPVQVLKNPSKGVSSARNFGAENATSSILFFMDTDVILPPDAIDQLKDAFTDSAVDGIVGVQGKSIRYTNFFSRYKNQWMRCTYCRLKDNIHLFYTSCAAIRKDVFLKTGGFDENYRLPSIEDTAIGAVLGRQGARIKTLTGLQVEHAKEYNLKSVLKTDFHRSSALVRYVLRNWGSRSRGGIRKTSVPKRFMLGSLFMSLAWLSIIPAILADWEFLWIFAIASICVPIINHFWIHHLAKEEGWLFAFTACLFLPLDVTFVVAGMMNGLTGFLTGYKY